MVLNIILSGLGFYFPAAEKRDRPADAAGFEIAAERRIAAVEQIVVADMIAGPPMDEIPDFPGKNSRSCAQGESGC